MYTHTHRERERKVLLLLLLLSVTVSWKRVFEQSHITTTSSRDKKENKAGREHVYTRTVSKPLSLSPNMSIALPSLLLSSSSRTTFEWEPLASDSFRDALRTRITYTSVTKTVVTSMSSFTLREDTTWVGDVGVHRLGTAEEEVDAEKWRFTRAERPVRDAISNWDGENLDRSRWSLWYISHMKEIVSHVYVWYMHVECGSS